MKKNKRKILLAISVIAICIVSCLIIYNLYPESKLPKDCIIDKIIVEKAKREMSVYQNGELLKTYKISLGHNPIGDKEYEGDFKTPEGIYAINDKNPNSECYKNLGISYPNNEDIIKAKRKGNNPGGLIKIHGLKNGLGFIGKFHRWFDWTHGCIGVTNQEVDNLFAHTLIGIPIEIKP